VLPWNLGSPVQYLTPKGVVFSFLSVTVEAEKFKKPGKKSALKHSSKTSALRYVNKQLDVQDAAKRGIYHCTVLTPTRSLLPQLPAQWVIR